MSSASSDNDRPLGLTVHSMPVPAQIAAVEGQRTSMGRWKMLAVLLICAAPVIASYFTYYVVRPEGRRNFGELIEPQRPLPDVVGTALDGQPVNLQSLKNQWLLVSVAGAACDDLCARHLYLQRQLREGLGKDKDRLDWVWLVSDDAPVADTLLPALKSATVLRVPAAALAQWLQPQQGHALAEHLYVVDPLGNWMMRFPPQLDEKGAYSAKRDLGNLMRASASWDKEGR
ncbi:hypothetical protein [Rhodoferax saidenbachensis]|uniref:Cytochrome C oxidase subunit I n=1 Tax=Rhodoferax saidenbachensis TaxID=1484693 RepID=A0A1P8KDH6_9BURK|nr:hypothetical protein [Rhodoferax saidenbachensis]APW44006.1 hypothetical protein RS694_16680 [Rhodoferax saidenbachensis]